MTRSKMFLTDLGERVIATFLQVFVATLIATHGSVSLAGHSRQEWFNSLFVALLAAAVAFLTTVLAWMFKQKPLGNRYADLVYRAVMTFGQTLLGYLVAAGAISALSFDWNTALLASVTAAGAALLKALIGVNSLTHGASVFVPSERAHPQPSAA